MNHFDFLPTLDTSMVYNFPNNGIIFDRLPKDLFDKLKKEVKKIEASFDTSTPYNNKLAGHIKNEYDMGYFIPEIQDYIVNLAVLHNKYYDHLKIYNVLSSSKPIRVHDLWVNFQKKHEFNPPHNHYGFYSFTIWTQIPYDINDEINFFPSSPRHTSMFNFSVSDILGNHQQYHLPIDKNCEGVICLFPSQLVHYVNPFYTSDDYRISVAGNLNFNVD